MQDLSPWFARPGALAFENRRSAMPFRNSVPLPGETIQPAWQNLCKRALTPNKRLVYLHIPFCATQCKFCGFYQNRFQPDEAARYVSYLHSEIELEAASPLHQSAPIHAVYFGGGTPTALAANDLYTLLRRLRASLPLAPDCEITVEGRILNFDDEKIDACLEAGTNRFSVGIQTFNTRTRKRMARTANREQAIAFLKNLCRRDRAAVVCDLIYGLPGQTAESWQKDLETVRDIGLDGVDLYALNLLPDTPLAKAVGNHRTTLPDVVQRRDLYLLGAGLLADYGWRQLSNSHWASATRERNLYNLLIKQGADCLALGAGAGGNLNGQAWMNKRRLEDYYAALEKKEKPIAMMTAATCSPWRHQLQGGIERGRLDLQALTPYACQLQPLIDQWHESGLLQDRSLCLRLTHCGSFWANNLLQALGDILPGLQPAETK